MSPYEFTNVLVAIDGSEGAQKALDCALPICARVGAELTALAVEGKLPAYAGSLLAGGLIDVVLVVSPACCAGSRLAELATALATEIA